MGDKSTMSFYGIIGKFGIVAVPIAPAYFFGYRVQLEILEFGSWSILATPVGVLSAAGLEIVGIMAGHSMIDNWRKSNYSQALLSAAIMLIYVSIGVWELQGTIGMVMFLVAPLVYVLSGMHDVSASVDSEQAGRRKVSDNFKIEEARKDAEARRERLATKQKQQHELKLLVATSKPLVEDLSVTSSLVSPTSKPVAGGYEYKCGCEKTFYSSGAWGGHRKLCKMDFTKTRVGVSGD